jgi:Domain of unknown function (DUF3883)
VATETPPWASASGLPTAYAVRAAIHVAATLDQRGSRLVDAHESYWLKATGGMFAPPDLARGQRLLVDCGLLEEREGTLYPQPELQQILEGALDEAIAAIYGHAVVQQETTAAWSSEEASAELLALIPDANRREELLLALGRRFDDAHRRLVGAVGEEVVVAALRAELNSLGYAELARSVRHLSLESDQLGYDITAPRIGGAERLIEVKAVTKIESKTVTVHLSRHEAEVGLRYRDWALVLCLVTDLERRDGEVVGWQPAAALAPALPVDARGGRWETVALELPVDRMVPGLPLAIA